MQNTILILLIITQQVSGFIIPNFFNSFINKVDVVKDVEIKNDIIHKMSNFNHEIISNGIQHFKTEYSPEIVKFSSGLLPAMDSIAHHVLKANQNFIGYVLNLDIPDHIKKELVLFSISSAQHGDQMGGHILDFYYHLVDKLL